MNLFAWLLLGHLMGDFLLQTSWMAEKKAQQWIPLLVHCFIYTCLVALFALLDEGLSMPAIAVIFVGHVFIDRRIFVDYWAKHISRSPDNTWLKIVQDQSWHIIILAAATLL